MNTTRQTRNRDVSASRNAPAFAKCARATKFSVRNSIRRCANNAQNRRTAVVCATPTTRTTPRNATGNRVFPMKTPGVAMKITVSALSVAAGSFAQSRKNRSLWQKQIFRNTQPAAPNTAPTPAVTAIANAPQKVTRKAPTRALAPPAWAANAPSAAKKASDMPDTQ